MKKLILSVALTALCGAMVVENVDAQARAGGTRTKANSAGGTTKMQGAAFAGSAGAGARGAQVSTDADGKVTGVSSGGAAGVYGVGVGARASSTTVDSETGTATRNSGAGAVGKYGAAATSASTTVNADGTVSGARNVEAGNTSGDTLKSDINYQTGSGVASDTEVKSHSGNSYQGSTTATKEGVQHSGGCFDATGDSIPCPKP